MNAEELARVIAEWFGEQEEYFDGKDIDDACIDGWFSLVDLATFILERLPNHAPSVRKDRVQVGPEGPDGNPADW